MNATATATASAAAPAPASATRSSLVITGARLAASPAPCTRRASHAPSASAPPADPAADDTDWTRLEAVLAARAAARSLHPSNRTRA